MDPAAPIGRGFRYPSTGRSQPSPTGDASVAVPLPGDPARVKRACWICPSPDAAPPGGRARCARAAPIPLSPTLSSAARRRQVLAPDPLRRAPATHPAPGRHDLARHGLPREKVLAAVVQLLETTRFRVGNSEYARLNQSFGLSTLRRRHATVRLAPPLPLPGKGGRTEERSVVDRRLADDRAPLPGAAGPGALRLRRR